MGLHSRTRYVIQPQGKDRTEQMRDIINRAVYLFNAVMIHRYTIEEISSNRKGTIKDGEEQELPF